MLSDQCVCRIRNFNKKSAADVAVRVRRGVVTVQVEQSIILVLVVVPTDVQHNAGRVVVAVVVG